MSRKDNFQKILSEKFNIDKFIEFSREFFPYSYQEAMPYSDIEPSRVFSYYVESYRHIGSFRTSEEKDSAIFAVKLKTGRGVENARSMQRNFLRTIMKNMGIDAAIAGFWSDGMHGKWRLSFVSIEYEFAKGSISEKITPAKRYSYLCGDGEPCQTAVQRLFPVLDLYAGTPSLSDLEGAFSVEPVTSEFFKAYEEKYRQLRLWLESNSDFRSESSARNFSASQFAKKLMGQIAFLYFLQKKGWLGVTAVPKNISEKTYKDACYSRRHPEAKNIVPKAFKKVGEVYERNLSGLSEQEKTILSQTVKGEDWGTGPKDFLRNLFTHCLKQKKNYFDEYLEPLFYNALNRGGRENSYFPYLNCRIPFLNGGLFEPLSNYDWESNSFSIPNHIFSQPEKGAEADGILDIFDRYNFTINEDEPLEQEVAVDPEMLGKIFENLLESDERKENGEFYTPRKIVHYMCREALSERLSSALNLPSDDVRDFVVYGEFMKDEDRYKKSGRLIPDSIYAPEKGIDRLHDIDSYLKNIKICDPAVGSGAFPLGLVNEIVKIRQNITEYILTGDNAKDALEKRRNERSPYYLKRETIKNCIFACDKESSAVDIAKLRLWLSLVIDDEVDPDASDDRYGHADPLALPNLDCNIICADSLVTKINGSSLMSKSVLLGEDDFQRSIIDKQYDNMLKKLIELHSSFFDESDSVKKADLKEQISSIEDEIVKLHLESLLGDPNAIDRYFQTRLDKSLPYALWQIKFPKVFSESKGFDIVIGNPPYIQLQTLQNQALEDEGYKVFAKTGDIYCLFYEKGYELLRNNGVLAFITSNKWMRAGYGEKLREFLAKNTNPLQLIDFAGNKIFKSATVDVNILIFEKDKNKEQTLCCLAPEESCLNNLTYFFKRLYIRD